MKGVWLKAGLLGCCLGGYLFFMFLSRDERLMGDELISVGFSEYYIAHGAFPTSGTPHWFVQPPLNLLVQSLVMRWFGATVGAARLVGITSFLIVLVLIFLIARRMAGRPGGWLAVIGWALVCFNPFAVHGSLLTDYVNTLVPVVFLTAVAHEVWCVEHPRWALAGRFVLLGVLTWTHFLSALMLSAWYIAEPLFSHWRKGMTEALVPILFQRLAIVLAAWALFVVGWAWYCAWQTELIRIPFGYFLHAINAHSPHRHSFIGAAQNVAGLVMWVTPWYAAMVLAALWAWLRGAVLLPSLLVFLTLGTLLGYLFGAGAISHGMPRYHYPFVGLSSLIVARWLLTDESFPRAWSPRAIVVLVVAALLCFVIQIGFIGDPIYALYYRLREAVILGAPQMWNQVTIALAGKYAALIALCAVAAVAVRRWAPVRLGGILLACYLGSALGLLWLQARAPYFTNYCYGGSRQDTETVLAFLRKQPYPFEEMMLTADLYYHLGWGPRGFRESVDKCYASPEKFLERAKRAQLIVTGLAINSVTTYRTVLTDHEVQALLAREFDRQPMGSYTVWLRKSANSRY